MGTVASNLKTHQNQLTSDTPGITPTNVKVFPGSSDSDSLHADFTKISNQLINEIELIQASSKSIEYSYLHWWEQ